MKSLGLGLMCAAWFCGGSSVSAAALGDNPPGRPGLTYYTLMRQVVPDLRPDGSGHRVVEFQHIAGKDQRADPPEAVAIDSVEAMPVPGDPSRILVLADLGPSEGNVADAVLLTLFDLSAKPKRLDLVEVGDDRNISFLTDRPPVLLAAGAPLILVSSAHENSSRSYLSVEMIFIRDGRFQFIDRISAVGASSCAYQRTRDPTFTTAPDGGSYRAVSVTIRQKITVTRADGCDDKAPKPGVSTYRALYRWDARTLRFATNSGAIRRLSADDAD